MIHEFAHVLDYYSTGLDGLAISNKQQQEIWKNNYREEEAKGNASIISEYGLSNPYEFFAVSSELFFTEQDRLKQHLPQLLSSLQKIYGYMPPNQKKLTTWQYYKLLFFSKVSLFKLP
jgi:Mlc titration factor MtfA (ptsG expression regulator)